MSTTVITKTYLYKVYDYLGNYLGLLNVANPFSYNQLIGTSFAQTNLIVKQTADIASKSVLPILDENGQPLLDENGQQITDEGNTDIVGPNTLINYNNTIVVYEVSRYSPNGKIVFQGYISKYKTVFGGEDDIEITCLSNGTDMNNILYLGGDTANITQSLVNSDFGIGTTNPKGFTEDRVLQTFQVGGSVLIGAVTVGFNASFAANMTIGINQQLGASPNLATDTTVSSGSIAISTTFTNTSQKVSITPVTLSGGITYYFYVSYSGFTALGLDTAFIFANTGNPYANGQAYTASYDGAKWTYTPQTGYDLNFIIWQHGGTVGNAETNVDVSNIVRDVITNYISQNGQLTAQSGGYTNTGIITSYTFKVQTILQALQVATGFASAADWYWYADPALNAVIFKQSSSKADFTIIKGRHINELDIEISGENIKNTVYFTGGNNGVANTYVKVQTGQGSNRIGLAQLSDNRVTDQGIAQQIAQNYLNTNNAITYITNVTILDNTMDISSIKLGMMCGFSGFGNFVNQLLLQVVAISYSPDQVTLQLGTLPIRQSGTVAGLEAGLAYQQTIANPSTPS